MSALKDKIFVINTIEKNGLSVFECEGINWWPLIRIYLFQNYEASDHKTNTKLFEKKNLIYPKRILWDLRIFIEIRQKFNAISRTGLYKKIKTANTCFLTSEINYKFNSDMKLINRYLDPLYKEMAGSKIIFVRDNKHPNNYVIPELMPTSYFELKWHLRNQIVNLIRTVFFFKEKQSYFRRYQEHFDKMIRHVRTFNYFESFNFSKLESWIDKVYQSAGIATLILERCKPKQLIQYCYYFPIQFGYTLAAKRLGIKAIDYQHGIQNNYHYAYGSWCAVPNKGYSLLPDEFWVYSNTEKENLLKSFSNTSHKIRVVGNKWISYWKENKSSADNWKLIDELKRGGYKIMLFTVSNYILNKEHYFWEYLNTVKDKKLFFLFRLHPGHLYVKKDLISNLESVNYNNYNIDDATSVELYYLLENIDGHITQNSTVAEEALYFGLNTIIIDEKWSMYFENYIKTGRMQLCSTIQDFEKIVKELL